MPALLPIILVGAHLVLAADRVPELNVDPGCRAPGRVATSTNRSEEACKQEEQTARQKLAKEWDQFTNAQQSHCARLSQLGGHPSYVELLTCLEMAKAAENLPADKKTDRETSGRLIH